MELRATRIVNKRIGTKAPSSRGPVVFRVSEDVNYGVAVTPEGLRQLIALM